MIQALPRPALFLIITIFLAFPVSLAHAQDKIRITYANNSLSFLAAFIAKDRGFYLKNGLNAELVRSEERRVGKECRL